MKASKDKHKVAQIKTWLKTGSINIFGLPFAGKDTHGRELSKDLDGVLIGGGDIIRSDHSLRHIQDHISTGSLAPTEEYLQIVLPYFSRPEFKNKPLILSSVGRWHGEEAGVLEATTESGHALKVVIYIDIDEKEMRHRWEASREFADRGKRRDDAEHVLAKRLDEFNTKTIPVINFYRDQGMLIEIDGIAEKDVVSENIINQLLARAEVN